MYIRGQLAIIVIAISSLYFCLRGFYQLAQQKRWMRILIWIIAIAFYPIAIHFVLQVNNNNLRQWMGFPLALGIFPWVSIGYFVNDDAQGDLRLYKIYGEKPRVTIRKRIVGICCLIVSIFAWIIGAFHPEFSLNQQLILMGICGYGGIFGLVWGIIGVPFN